MILTKDAIRALFQGVIYVEEGPSGGLVPSRFSKVQREAYAPFEAFSIRTHSATGCCLALETDAEELFIRFRAFTGSAHDFYGLDLMVDGLLFAHSENSFSEKPDGEWRISLPAGEKSLKLHLPNLAGIEITALELLGATFFRPVNAQKRILFMGDSITMGYIAHFPSGTYPARIATALNAEYLNQAIGGETFHPEILDDNLDWKPDLIILGYGTNDWALKDRQHFTKDASEFVRRITAIWPGVPVVMITPIWRADYLTRRDDDFHFMEARSIMEEIASGYSNVSVIAGEYFVPWSRELLADHIHPNDLGFVYYAERLFAQLKAINLA